MGISQKVAKISITDKSNNIRTIEADANDVDVELNDSEMEQSIVIIEYDIEVTNYGNVDGEVKQIVNHMPKGMIFNSELNPDWYLAQDGNLYSNSLRDINILPGDSQNLKLVLTKDATNGNIGIIRGRSEIEDQINEKGIEPISALLPNYENTIASNIVIKQKSSVRVIVVIGLSIGLLALIGLAVYEIKKHYIDKMYNYEDLKF